MSVSQAFTSAGTTFAIGAAPATYDAAGFAAVTFTTVGEITDIGSYGKKYNLVTHMPLADRRVVKRRGSYNNGTLQVKLAKAKTSDAGQTALKAAVDSDNSISVKIVLQNNEINYFTAQVMSLVTNVGGVDQITGYEVELELDNDIIVV
jgi:hypothetical protein